MHFLIVVGRHINVECAVQVRRVCWQDPIGHCLIGLEQITALGKQVKAYHLFTVELEASVSLMKKSVGHFNYV